MASHNEENWIPGPVRTRAKAKDPYEGLRGHDYIKARGISKPPVKRLDANNEPSQRFNFLMSSSDGKKEQVRRQPFCFLPELTISEES